MYNIPDHLGVIDFRNDILKTIQGLFLTHLFDKGKFSCLYKKFNDFELYHIELPKSSSRTPLYVEITCKDGAFYLLMSKATEYGQVHIADLLLTKNSEDYMDQVSYELLEHFVTELYEYFVIPF